MCSGRAGSGPRRDCAGPKRWWRLEIGGPGPACLTMLLRRCGRVFCRGDQLQFQKFLEEPLAALAGLRIYDQRREYRQAMLVAVDHEPAQELRHLGHLRVIPLDISAHAVFKERLVVDGLSGLGDAGQQFERTRNVEVAFPRPQDLVNFGVILGVALIGEDALQTFGLVCVEVHLGTRN